jgi:tRNA pseudouridine55 synthase
VFQSKSSCFITLNKKRGYSSASSLNRFKSILKIKKAGFCGTLDPIAEGVIVVAINKATKLISLVTEMNKTYTGRMKLGFTSPSYDTETDLKSTEMKVEISEHDLRSLEKMFSGEIAQIPPSYSALKVEGKRAYDIAREGGVPDLKKRKVMIYSLELAKSSPNELDFKVVCSKGTYIRSLVNDIGIKTGFGAVMTSLRREEVGIFSIENSVMVDELKENPELIDKTMAVTTLDSFLMRYNTIDVDDVQYNYFRNGNDISKSGIEFPEGLSYVRYLNEPAFLVENRNGSCSYFAFLRNEDD